MEEFSTQVDKGLQLKRTLHLNILFSVGMLLFTIAFTIFTVVVDVKGLGLIPVVLVASMCFITGISVMMLLETVKVIKSHNVVKN